MSTSTKKISVRKLGHDNKNKERLTEKAKSFHGHSADQMVGKLRRPRTLPDLASGPFLSSSKDHVARPKLTKLLLNVTVQRSLGPVQVLISPESTVRDLIADALKLYSKEGRRPILPSLDPSCFGLHYSQFSLQSLDPEEKLIELGSRNFFLCPKQIEYPETLLSSCSEEAENVTKPGAGWLRFMNFLQ
ncbi:hypothetical protein QVD17_36509 [Tagetes erecta]|uniref:DUF7054 domain-containing protein n=1 Tax=Tagetes erecta TaxID=13708 RepID=A0AAD8JUF4_TARER|nr:hypothetical protein QVD17_36509 [Tagetes erecta]